MKRLLLPLLSLSLLCATPQARSQSTLVTQALEHVNSLNLRPALYNACIACAKPFILAKSLVEAYPYSSLGLGVLMAIMAAKASDLSDMPEKAQTSETLFKELSDIASLAGLALALYAGSKLL